MTWPRPRPTVGDPSSAAERRENPTAWRFPPDAINNLYEIISSRRDIRRFRPDPVPEEIVKRVLLAAHAGPSVGHSQPWRFILVQASHTRHVAATIADRERLRQADALDPDASRRLLDLQLEGIREAPLGIVVCCDRRTAPQGVLGRATFHDTDLWSCACAIENLWLAARAEGLGVGWVTLFPPDELAALVGLPQGVATLGWLCLGWPDERPPEPGLMRAGWSTRLPLEEVVLHERWSQYETSPPRSHLAVPSQNDVITARDASDQLLTPPGSLGILDRTLDKIASLGITTPAAALIVVGADHRVAAHGVSTYPTDVTREILEASAVGESLGAATAQSAGIDFIVIDAGLLGPPIPSVPKVNISEFEGDILTQDAFSITSVKALIRFGYDFATQGLDSNIVALGEIGIGNTTIASALLAALTGASIEESTGLGAGGDSSTLQRKRSVVEESVRRAIGAHGSHLLNDPLVALSSLGGAEIAVLTGIVQGVSSRGGVVVTDGFATTVAALCAERLTPGVAAHLIAGQRSRERGHQRALEELGLEPLLDLRIRAGEGVGAGIATGLILTGLRMRELTGRVVDLRAR